MSVTDSPSYVYAKRLRHDEMRILTVLSHGTDGIVRCSLDVYGSSNVPEYQALSYCWGSEEDTAVILIGREHLRVGRNAHLALAHLCKAESLPINIWIDAICINQSDNAEKSAQVGRMHAIYSDAALVIAWLGEAMQESQGMLEEMVCLAKKSKIEWRDAKRWFDIADQLVVTPWFTRVWVIQEAALASDIRFQHGDGSITWDDIKILLDRRLDYTLAFPLVGARASALAEQSSLQIFGDIRMGATSGECQVKRLDHLILSLAGLKCKDPRDRVFGLVGVAERLKFRVPRVDYGGRATIKEVLVDEMMQQFAVLEDGWSALLSAQDHNESGSLDIPSWMPNLEKRRKLAPLPYNLYRAGGRSASPNGSMVSNDRSTLTINAVEVCCVHEVAKKFTNSATLENIHGYIDSLIKQPAELKIICENTARKYPSTTVESNMEALGITMSADCKAPVDTSYRILFFDVDMQRARRGADAADLVKTINSFSGTTAVSKVTLGIVKAGSKAVKIVPTSLLSRIPGSSFGSMQNDNPNQESLRTRAMMCANRSLIVTNTGAFGLCPRSTQPGDIIVVSPGVNAPIILRCSGRCDDRYVMVGGAYIKGLMDGEAMIDSQAKMRTFVIE